MKEIQYLGLSLIPVSLLGLLFNGAIVWAIWKDKTVRSSFMMLTFAKTFCDAAFVFFYFVYIVPMIVLDVKIMQDRFQDIGYFMLIFYESALNIHFISSTNRFCAVFFPVSYQRVFSTRTTKLSIAVAATYSFLFYTIVTWFYGCRYIYDAESWATTNTSPTPACQWYAFYGDFVKNSLLVLICVTVDIITLTKVMTIRKMVRRQKKAEVYSKKDADFLKQTCGAGIGYIADYIWFVAFPETSNNYYSFFSSLFCYVTVAMLTGFMTIIYNSDVRKRIFANKKEEVSGKAVPLAHSISSTLPAVQS